MQRVTRPLQRRKRHVVSLYWSSKELISSTSSNVVVDDFTGTPGAGASYLVDNIHATIETIGLADAVYDNMVSSMIAAKKGTPVFPRRKLLL